MTRNRALLTFLCLAQLILGCSRPVDYLYEHPAPPPLHSYSTVVNEIVGINKTNKLDIFWLIGGMTEQSYNFTTGVSQFMTSFVDKKLDWRMAVTNDNEAPQDFLGLSIPFDSTIVNPVGNLENAVNSATNSNDGEVVFDPIYLQLQNYPQFVRPDGLLIIIMTNDARDGSRYMTTADQMTKFLAGLKGGDLSKVIVYGIFGATDLGCSSGIDEDWNFYGSEFDKLIKSTGGQVYSLCDSSFGAQLGKIGDDVYQHLQNPKISLTSRPDLATLRVFFHGVELKGGPADSGGSWYYDVNDNAVIFYNLDFANGTETESVDVQYVDQVALK